MIRPEDAKYPEQRELIEFMKEYSVSVGLAAKLLGISKSFMHFYRRGAYASRELRMSQERINDLKSSYKTYMLEKLAALPD